MLYIRYFIYYFNWFSNVVAVNYPTIVVNRPPKYFDVNGVTLRHANWLTLKPVAAHLLKMPITDPFDVLDKMCLKLQ